MENDADIEILARRAAEEEMERRRQQQEEERYRAQQDEDDAGANAGANAGNNEADEEQGSTEEEEDRRRDEEAYDSGPQDYEDSSTANGNGKKKSGTAAAPGTTDTHLFLVEFLVDCVIIDSCSVDDEVLEGQTCLTLSFLNFPPMEICEKDFDPNKEGGFDKVRFNSGKSLMFAFNRKQCENPPPLLIEITVSKKLEDEEEPCKVEIGTTKICISDIFRQIVNIAKFTPDKLPSSKAIKDCFMLVGPGKRTMGEVSVYVRLSCLGQNVVTEFQCGPDLQKSPVLFKSREGRKIYEFTGNEDECEAEAAAGGRRSRAGQGDAGKNCPSVDKAFAEGNRVVLDLGDKSERCRGERSVDRPKVPDKAGECRVITDKTKTKEALSVSQLDPDPDQNLFILKVGDKGMIPDRGKMILEFRTPKQKIMPKILPPYHEDVAVQTERARKKKRSKKKAK